MAVYSIKDLEKLCGIKAHTLRIWEQRYGIIKPKRTPTNIRYYEDADLKLLLNIALLNKNGFKISKIAKMSGDEIGKRVSHIAEINAEFNTQLDSLTIAMIEMDEYKFNLIVSNNIQKIGFEKTMLHIIYPFLDKLSLLWLTGSVNPAQESFISHLIRQKIIVAIDNLPLKQETQDNTFLLYLPEGEMQELTLLFVYYIIKSRGQKVIYLGQNISLLDINDAYNIHQPNFIFTMINEGFNNQSVQSYINSLSSSFQGSRILLSGYQLAAQEINAPYNVSLLNSLKDCILFLNAINQKSII